MDGDTYIRGTVLVCPTFRRNLLINVQRREHVSSPSFEVTIKPTRRHLSETLDADRCGLPVIYRKGRKGFTKGRTSKPQYHASVPHNRGEKALDLNALAAAAYPHSDRLPFPTSPKF